MKTAQPELTAADALMRANAVDHACDLFESSWKRGARPQIAEFLDRSDESVRSILLIELVKLDLYYRTAAGEAPDVHDYTSQFPEFADELTDLAHGTDPDFDLTKTWRLPRNLERVAHYELRDHIGQGAFSSVWNAWDTKLQRTVALKLPGAQFMEPMLRDMFLHEARAAAQLDHPNIVPVHDYGEHGDGGYIAFSLVEGLDLKRWLKLRRPTPRAAAAICLKLADALAHAHEHGVVHRDLKPANIIMDGDDQPRITDFGLAKRVDIDSTIAPPGEPVGTYPYMSPEQIHGDANVDAQSDLYSLGVLLYEMLTGEVPFTGDRRQVTYQIANDPPKPLRKQNKAIPRDLETICLKCLAKEKPDRYATTADLRDDLQRFLNNEPIHARRISALERVWRRVTRRPVQTVAALSVLFLAIAASAAGFWLSSGWSPVDDSKWEVRITSKPPGASVRITPINPVTGLPVTAKMVHLHMSPDGVTPVTARLRPGQYKVIASIGADRFAEVVRTVPSINATVSLARSYHFWHVDGGELRWSPVPIPEVSVTRGMILIPAASGVQLGVPGSEETPPCVVDLNPFYVAPDEFCVGDYLKIRQSLPDRMPSDAPRDEPMQVRFDEAMQWSEDSGGRLLTEFEFEYLCRLFAAHRSGNLQEITRLTKLTGVERDSLVKRLAVVRNVLDGQAEWVWGGYEAYTRLAGMPPPVLPNPDVPGPFQVLRGGDPRNPRDYPDEQEVAHWDPSQRSVERYTVSAKGCGFRLARTATSVTPSAN